jgi:hypothetical protein
MQSVSETLRSVGLPESVWEGAAAAGIAYGVGASGTPSDAVLLGVGTMVGSLLARGVGLTGVGDYPQSERYLRTAVCGAGATAGSMLFGVGETSIPWTAGSGMVGHVLAQTLLYGDIGSGGGSAIVF